MLAVLFGASFIAAFNENIVNVGLVDIMAEFSVSAATAQWLVTGYMIVTAVVVTLMAFLTKRFSLRSLFFAGSCLLFVGSILAILAPSFPVLLGARLIQAGGSGIFIPSMMNTVLSVAPKSKLGTYLSIGGCTITFGPALAPVVAGLVVTMVGWRSIFALPAIFVAILALFGFFTVRKIAEPQRVRLDAASVVLSAAGLTSFVLGLGQITVNLPLSIASIVLGVGCIAIFARCQSRLDEPIIDLSPLRKPQFLLACLLVVVAMMTTFSMSVLLPLYFEGAVGLTALMAGGLILAPILVNAVTTIIGGRAMDRKGTWPLLPFGFLVISLGLLAAALAGETQQALPVVLASVIVYAGVGLVFSSSQTAGLKHLTRDEHPFGVGIMSTFIQVAACIGPALFVGVLSTIAGQVQADTGNAPAAQASGFAAAVIVAAAIGFVGFLISFIYARRDTARTAQSADETIMEDPQLT